MTRSTEELERLLSAFPQTSAIELLLPDLNGILRGKRIGMDEFATLYSRGINLPASTQILDSRGHSITPLGLGSRDGDPDFLGVPVPGSLVPVPWSPFGLAQCLLDMRELDRRPLATDPREILRRVVARLRADGLHPVTAIELEFYLLRDDRARPPLSQSGRIPGTDRQQQWPQMYSIEDLQDLDPLLHDIAEACDAQGLPASTAISEYAPGQFEINLHHVSDPLLACDHAVLLRRLVRSVSRGHDLAATFMAKPFTAQGGSGQHVHVSLLGEAGENLLAGEGGSAEPTLEMGHAAAGLLAHMAESMLIFCPNPNSFRRLQPGNFAPVTPNWGHNHRNVAVRLPLARQANCRLEHRVPGADANPYLVMAVILAAIHRGLDRRMMPPAPVPEGERAKIRPDLPNHWQAALARFEASEFLAEYLGEGFVRRFATARRFECESFDAEVSNLDYDWYLRSI
jgi:glutamine synthetase